MHRSAFLARMSIGLACGTLAVGIGVANSHARSARVQTDELPLIGSRLNGSEFTRNCPDNHVLTGFRYRAGLVLDAIAIKCRPVRLDGTLGAEILSGSFAGGDGGTLASKSCPANSVIASQWGFGAPGTGVAILRVHCYQWSAATFKWGGTGEDLRVLGPILPTSTSTSADTKKCTYASRPAMGIRGRQGAIIDAVGLVCNTH